MFLGTFLGELFPLDVAVELLTFLAAVRESVEKTLNGQKCSVRFFPFGDAAFIPSLQPSSESESLSASLSYST